MRNFGRFGFLVFLVQLLVAVIVRSDASALDVINGTYKLPAQFDAKVTTLLRTELWADVWRPSTGGPYPLLVFLHGNHATCGRFDAGLGIRVDDDISYTTTGTCPSGYVVAPSQAGYNYLARPLASQGYVVVTINANRGVNAAPGEFGDAGLNLRRGRLVLRHLEELAKWNSGTASPPPSLGFSLLGLLDFSHVGLMGHSRGGEGMRAAMAQFRDAGSPWPARIGPVGFKALFEIGPVDGQTSRILNAKDVSWNVLLPGCDGDVSDLQGIKPLDRMIKAGGETLPFKKSNFEVYGANHNFYNTQWQESDAFGCVGQTAIFPQLKGSAAQRTTAYTPLIRFFRAHVGPTIAPALARLFDPSFPLPANLTAVTQYARGFSPTVQTSQYFVVDDFENATGISSKGVANQSAGLTTYVHGNAGSSHDATQRAANVAWSSPAGFLQLNDTTSAGIDVSPFRALEFRVGIQCFQPLCSAAPDPTGDVDFSISIANADGSQSSALTLKSLAVVRRPVGSFSANVIMQTVRVPLTQFTGAQLASFKGVRFTFNRTSSSRIYLANVRLDKTPTGPGGLLAVVTAQRAQRGSVVRAAAANEINRIVAIRRKGAAAEAGRAVVEIEVYSSRAFPVSNALPVLTIGDKSFDLSRFDGQDTHKMVFVLPAEEYAELKPADVSVRIGGAAPWRFGRLVKQ
jgi:hypothetical protein